MAQAKACSHCGGAVQAHEQQLHAGYDKIELLQVTAHRAPGGAVCRAVAPLWAVLCGPSTGGAGPRHALWDSIQSLATSRRYPHAISYERLSALFTQVYEVSISEGALTNPFQRVQHPSEGPGGGDFDPYAQQPADLQ